MQGNESSQVGFGAKSGKNSYQEKYRNMTRLASQKDSHEKLCLNASCLNDRVETSCSNSKKKLTSVSPSNSYNFINKKIEESLNKRTRNKLGYPNKKLTDQFVLQPVSVTNTGTRHHEEGCRKPRFSQRTPNEHCHSQSFINDDCKVPKLPI
jgi:hypothetical protein